MDRFLSAPRDLLKIDQFWTLSKINKNGVAVRLVRLLAALGAPKSKKRPQHGPKKRHFWTPNGQNATCCQSSSKHKFYNNSPAILLYLILNKLYFRCFCVLRSIKSDLRFYLHLEMDKKASWRRQEAEKVPTETFWDDCGPQVEVKRGPTSTLRATKTGQETP